MPAPDTLRVIGRLELPAFDKDDFPGFELHQIVAGLTTPATTCCPQHAPEYAARICPVFRWLIGPQPT